MPHRTRRIPKYRHYKPKNLGVVRIDGKDCYLGRYNSPKSLEKYHRLITEWLSKGCVSTSTVNLVATSRKLSVNRLMLAFWRFAKTYYQRDGEPTSEMGCLRDALRPLRQLYGRTAAVEFGPKSLKAVRQSMIDAGLCRGVINSRTRRIKAVFKWGVEEELLPPSVYHALQAVPGLRKGRTTAREPEPVRPVTEEVVEATLLHLPKVIRDMVRFQRLTGCRPTEACIVRPVDIDCSGSVWEYRPTAHKTQHCGRERIIFIGPKAQDILRGYLLRPTEAYCFSPRDSEKARNAERRANRKSAMTPSQAKRRPKKNPRRQPRDHYDRNSYRRAIHRAVDTINKKRKEDAEKAGGEAVLLPKWSPNQLRHTAGTEIRRHYGIEAAQTVLGHAQADVTQIYAERDHELAARIMREVG